MADPACMTTLAQSTRPIAAAIALLSLCAAGCTGFGDTPDPGAAPSTPFARGLLNLPDFAPGTVGHVVVDNTGLFAMVHGMRGKQEAMSLFELDKTGGLARELWTLSPYITSNSQAWPLMLSRPGGLDWVVRPFQGTSPSLACAMFRWSKGDASAPSKTAELSGSQCEPVGIAGDDQDVFVFVSEGNGFCAYDFAGAIQNTGCITNPMIYRLSSGAASPTPIITTSIVSTAPNPVWFDGTNLYWFTQSNGNGPNWPGGALVSMPRSGSTTSTVMTLDAMSYPMGMAFAGDSIVVATSRPTGDQGYSSPVTGCVLSKVPKQGGTPTQIGALPDRVCRGLSVDATHAWFTTGWTGTDDAWHEGIQRTRLLTSTPEPALALERDNLNPLVTLQNGDSLIVVAPHAVISVPKSILP